MTKSDTLRRGRTVTSLCIFDAFTRCFLKLVSPTRCGSAGESTRPLQWAVMYNRGNAEVWGYCGGPPSIRLLSLLGVVPSSVRTSPLVGSSGRTAKADWQLLPKLEPKQQFPGNTSYSEQIPKFPMSYVWDPRTAAYAIFWVTNRFFCQSRLPKPSILWITYFIVFVEERHRIFGPFSSDIDRLSMWAFPIRLQH